MARRVVCIARVLGAGGSEVGRIVADRLGYRFVDEEIVQEAAESQGVSVDELADAERRMSVMERLLKNLALAGSAAGYMGGGAGVPIVSVGSDPRSLRAMIQRSIHETADRGEVVIVSHAASYALAGRGDVLRVLVTAPPETRCARTAQDAALDAKKAAKAVSDADAARATYLKNFYGVGEELATHYDLALNSDSLSVELIGELVVRAAE